MQCPNCGVMVQSGAPQFCPQCGAALGERKSGPSALVVLSAILMMLVAMTLGAAGACFGLIIGMGGGKTSSGDWMIPVSLIGLGVLLFGAAVMMLIKRKS